MTFDDALAITSWLTSVVGIPLAFILARRTRQKPDLRWLVDFDILVSPEDALLTGVVVTSQGRPIRRISLSRIAIWNHRGDPVRGTDILRTDPLRIAFIDDEVLQARLIAWSRDQNAVRATLGDRNGKIVSLDFDFLDSGDGVIIEVIHQGERPPVVTGTVRGASITSRGTARLTPKAIRSAALPTLRRSWKIIRNSLTELVSLTGCVLVSSLAVSSYFSFPPGMVFLAPEEVPYFTIQKGSVFLALALFMVFSGLTPLVQLVRRVRPVVPPSIVKYRVEENLEAVRTK